MIKYCLDQWNKNKEKLRIAVDNDTILRGRDYDYEYLVKLVVKHILGDGWDYKNITTIDNGDYGGTLLFLIPENTYQPSEYEYLMTYVNYGSCSGCDTLLSIQECSVDDNDMLMDIMTLCKDLVANMICPYNIGWRNDSRFEQVDWED